MINRYKVLIIKCLIYVRLHKVIKKMLHCHNLHSISDKTYRGEILIKKFFRVAPAPMACGSAFTPAPLRAVSQQVTTPKRPQRGCDREK